MKKFIIFLFLLCLPCYASLQDEFEKTQFNSLKKPSTFAKMLIVDDKEGYAGGEDTIYGRIIKAKIKYSQLGYKNDVKYLTKVLTMYSQENPAILVVDNETYKTLQNETKRFIAFYNTIAKLYKAEFKY